MNLFFLPLKSLTLTSLFNSCFRAHTLHLKLITCLDGLGFSHTNSLMDYLFPHLRAAFYLVKNPNSSVSFLWLFFRESFLFLQFRQAPRAAEVGGNYSCPWRLCRLRSTTKERIFQQQVAAWVSTCKIPAQSTLGNLVYSVFCQQIILFPPPHFNPLKSDFPSRNPPEATDFLTPDTPYCLKAMLWKVIFIYPFNIEWQRKYRAKASEEINLLSV